MATFKQECVQHYECSSPFSLSPLIFSAITEILDLVLRPEMFVMYRYVTVESLKFHKILFFYICFYTKTVIITSVFWRCLQKPVVAVPVMTQEQAIVYTVMYTLWQKVTTAEEEGTPQSMKGKHIIWHSYNKFG